jgi:hydrogenase nickel incorporation protein HypA/HybF
MHELSIARSIVGIVDEAAKGRRVRRVVLEIGQLSGVVPEAISFCFEAVAEGTAAQGAVLDIRQIEGRARCMECSTEFATPSLLAACACGCRRLSRLSGEELNVKSIVTEEAA